MRSTSSEFTAATLAFVDELQHRFRNTIVNILIPELHVEHWSQHVLRNQSTLILEGRPLFEHSVAVTSIPYGVEDPESVEVDR